jgi:hypothetical protein
MRRSGSRSYWGATRRGIAGRNSPHGAGGREHVGPSVCSRNSRIPGSQDGRRQWAHLGIHGCSEFTVGLLGMDCIEHHGVCDFCAPDLQAALPCGQKPVGIIPRYCPAAAQATRGLFVRAPQ